MTRWLTWISDQRMQGWTCSQCGWLFPIPSLLSASDAKSAYDRLASGKFQEHDCSEHGPPTYVPDADSFVERARKLVVRGFKPKDAADLTLQEITLEYRSDAAKLERARADAADFLRRVKDGLI